MRQKLLRARKRVAPRARVGKGRSNARARERSCCVWERSRCTPTAPTLHNPHRVSSFERGRGRGVRRESKGGECGGAPEYGGTIFESRKTAFYHTSYDDATVGQLRGCFLDVLGRMVEDEEIRNKIDAQSLDYEGLRGDAFSNKLAKQNLQNLNPRTCCFSCNCSRF